MGFDRSVGWSFPSLAPVRVKLMLLLLCVCLRACMRVCMCVCVCECYLTFSLAAGDKFNGRTANIFCEVHEALSTPTRGGCPFPLPCPLCSIDFWPVLNTGFARYLTI